MSNDGFIPTYFKARVESLADLLDEDKWIEYKTPRIEKLGFCPHCWDPLLHYAIEWNDGAVELARVCTWCGYTSEYHYDVLSTFVEDVKNRKIMKISVWMESRSDVGGISDVF